MASDNFKILADSPKDLLEKLEVTKKQLKNAKTREEQMAISNYIYLLDDSIARISPDYKPIDKIAFLSDKDNEALDRKYYAHSKKMMINYLENKEFHKKFFEIIYKKTSHARKKIEEDEYSGITDLSENDYYNLFFDFMNKIGQSKTFDRFVKNKRIYTTDNGMDSCDLGYTLFNPITKDSDIFIDDFDYNVFTMFTLAHEFGHVYDLNHFDESISVWNTYFYQSLNGEVVSKTFERLFVDYLLDNNILVPEAKDMLFDMCNWNIEYVLTSYIISLIPDIYIADGSYLKLSPTKIYKLVERYFNKKNNVRKFINKCSNIDIKDTYQYAYGDIISLILTERIRQDDYNLDALDEFFEHRYKPFSIEMLNKLRVNPTSYVKLYKKDIELLKKQSN